MKTKAVALMFLAKIARNVACLSAFLALSASAATVAKVGEASSVDLDAFIIALKEANYEFDGSTHKSAQDGKLTVKWSPVSGCFDNREGHTCTVGNVKATGNTPKRRNSGLLQFQMFEGESHAVRVKNVAFVYEPTDVTICINSGWRGSFTADQAPAGQLYFLNTGDVAFEGCSFDKVVLSSFNCTGASTVKDCSFKNVYNNYAVKDIRGGTIAVTGCSFENCGAAVMVSAVEGSQVSQVTISGNTFKNVDVAGTAAEGKVGTRGLVQIAKEGDYENASFNFSDNTATDCGPVLRQLNATVRFDEEDKSQLNKLVVAGGSLYTTDSVSVVAAVGKKGYESLEKAIEALSAENYTLTLRSEEAWPAETPVRWTAGTQSGSAATLTAALTAAYKANAGAITIVCRPGANVGTMTHGHVADDLTIYGNNAYLSGGECDLEVDTFRFSRATGAVAEDGAVLTEDIAITAYELDNLGVWGERHTDYTVSVTLTDCDGKALEGKENGQRVYISGTTGQNNITLTGCDFLTAKTAVYSNADGTIKATNCSFTGGAAPFNINHKADGAVTVTVEDCTFTGCGDADGWKQFAAPVRFVNSGKGTMTADVAKCEFSETVGANGDILLGDGRAKKESNDVTLKVSETAADVQAQKPGYYTGETTDTTKGTTTTTTKEETLETSVEKLLPTDPRTLGYATSGAAAALPAAPDMGGTVVNVTAAQAQYVLDGAYGSIDGKTINFTESVADTLVLGRASKYVGSGTLYRHGSHDGEAMSYADFIAYKNQATWTESCYYERTVENVTFTADAGVVVNFTAEGGAHVYAAEGETAPVYDYVRDTGEWVKTGSCFFKRAILKNITFKGLTFKAKTNFETSESTTVYDGFTFTGCTFEIGSTAAGNYALRYYSENNNGCVRNLVVENCTFRNCFQGIYTHHVKGITVKDSTFETTGHNAIAIQSTDGKGACDHGAVVITGNTFKNIGDRIIRFNAVGAGTTITIVDNTADGNSGKVVTGKREIVKAASLPENAAEIITASGNDWGANAVVGNDAFADTVKTEKALRKAFAEAPTDGTAVTVKLGADITLETLYAAENFGTETLADNAEGDTFNRYKIGVHPTAEDPSHWNPLVTSQTEAERVVYGAYYHSGATDERIARLVVKAGQKIVLDLNGHTIQKNARATHGDWLNVCTDIIGNYGTLEIVDSSEGAKGTVKGIGYKSCSGAVLHNYEGASMTVGAVNVDGNAAGMADETGQYVISNEGGTLVIDGANVFDTATSASLVMSASGTVTIRNATLSHPATKVINAKGGVIDIESASVTSEKYAIFATKDATVNVKGAVTITGAGTLHVEGDAATIAKMPDVELPAPDGFVWVAEGESQILKPVAATIGAVSYETLDAAIKAVQDGETIVVNAGEYKLTGSQSAYSGKAFTVKAAENAAVSFDMSAAVTLGGAKITFEGVTFDYKTNGDYIGLQHADTLVYNDCTINGKVFLYAASETFNRCTFNQSVVDYNVWTYGAKKVAFNGCTFNCAGKSVLVYNEGATEKTDLTVASCEFKATAEAAGKAAIEIDTSLMKDGASVAIDGQTTATGFATGSNSGSALWNDKKQTKDTNKNVTVTVAGETVFAPVAAKIGETGYASLAEALAAAKAGETVKLLADATEDVAVATSVTLDLGGKTLTNAGAGKVTLTIAEGATVTVKNGSIVGGASNYAIQNNGTATFEDVTATAGNVGSSMLDNSGTLTINSGNYSGGENVVKSEEDSTLLITGGTFTLGHASNGYTAVILVYGDTTITGGTFIQNGTGKWVYAQVVMTGVVDGHTAITRVKGGTFSNNSTASTCKIFHGLGKATSDNFEVSGGTFNKSISDGFCAAGFIPAKNSDGTYGVKEGAYVAEIGSTKYETLSAALAAAKKGKTVKLLADATEDVAVATSVTLDLGGKTLTNAGAGKVTLTIAEGATVTVKNGGIVGGASNYAIQNNGTATFEDVTATAGNVGSSMLDNFGTLTINSGTYVGGMNTVKNEPKATLTVNGGTFENSYGENNAHTGVIYNLGHVTITGGELMQKATEPLWAGPHVVMTDWDGSNKPSVTITGGMFTSVWKSYRATVINDAGGGTAGCTAVSGGTFNKKVPENYCAAGYIPTANDDGTYGVKEGAYVAAIGAVKYETLAEAIAAAKAGDTVTLLADALTVEATKTDKADRLMVGVDLTLELNGHTLTTPFELEPSSNWASFYITGGSLTVKDSVGNGGIRSGDKDHLGTYLFHLQGGDLIVESGNFFGGCTIANVQKGTATIKGGRFEVFFEEDVCRYLLNCIDENYKDGSAHVVVFGGTFVGYDPRNNAAEGLATNFVAPGVGVDADENGVFTAKPDMCAQITDADGNSVTAHKTLQAAFDAAKKGDTVTLLADITLTEQVNITKALDGLTLDGNNKTITCATTTDPLQSGGSALYFGNADSKLYCTGIAIKDLTMTGTARFAIFLCGGTSTTFTNVKISGRYYIAVNLYGTHGATMTGCEISNSTTGTDKYISAIWSNVASANPLTLNNTKVDVIAINAYTTDNELEPKIYVNAGSTVDEIHTYDDGSVSGDTRLCVGGSPVMPSVKIYDKTSQTWIDAPDVVFVDALIGGGRVTLSDALLAQVTGATRFKRFTNLSKEDENGNLAWVNLVAGIDPAQKVSMTAPQNDDPTKIDVDLAAVSAAPAGTDVTVTYEIVKDGSEGAVASEVTADSLALTLDGTAGIGVYRAVLSLSQNGTEVARIGSANALGVLQTVRAAKKTIIAVPWLSLTDGNAIAVADLVKTAGLTAGDKLHVYNKAENRYDVYELTTDKVWSPKAIYKVGADGTVETASSGTPETTTVARGSGVWLERQDTTKPIVSYGAAATSTTETTLDAGRAEKPTWNLLAVPTTTAVNLAETFGTSETDKIIVPTDGAPKICTVKDGVWGYDKTVSVTDKFGNETGVRSDREAVTELPAGTGFWYLNGGAAKTVNW